MASAQAVRDNLPARPSGDERAAPSRSSGPARAVVPSGGWAVETHGLTKRFGANVAVDDAELLVPRGCAFGYLGQRLVVGIAMDQLRPAGLAGGGAGGPGHVLFGGRGALEIPPMPTWAMISVIVGWIVGWSVIGAWRMMTRDA